MNKNFSRTFYILMLLFSWIIADAQISLHSLGFEGQIYPTGYLLGVRAELPLSNRQAIDLRVGANIFDHQDFGVQDEEVGEGYGFTIGYRYYFSEEKKRWFIGGRSDFWWNTVEWKSLTNTEMLAGTTDIFVVQPTAIVGFVWKLKDNFQITPTAALGFEINAVTNGEPTGEGAIFLGGLSLDYIF